jgi:hypothetical protein
LPVLLPPPSEGGRSFRHLLSFLPGFPSLGQVAEGRESGSADVPESRKVRKSSLHSLQRLRISRRKEKKIKT